MISRTCDGSSRKTARTRTLYQTCVRPPRAPLSIFEPPLISRNRDDGDRPRPIEFGIQTARLCQIAVRSDELRGGLKIISSNDEVGEEGAVEEEGSTGVGYHGMRLKLTLNDFSTLLPLMARAKELMTRGTGFEFQCF